MSSPMSSSALVAAETPPLGKVDAAGGAVVEAKRFEVEGISDAETVSTVDAGCISDAETVCDRVLVEQENDCCRVDLMRRPCVQLIGAPFAEGQNLRGTELAPDALRAAGLKVMLQQLGCELCDDGDLTHPSCNHELNKAMKEGFRRWMKSGSRESYQEWSGFQVRCEAHVSWDPQMCQDPYSEVQNSKVIGECCLSIHEKVVSASKASRFALSIGGDHSIAAGSIHGLLEVHPDLCVVWVDAHADANTPSTSPSNHYHGMPAAHLMGWFARNPEGFEWFKNRLPANRLVYIGLRDLDPAEAKMLRESDAHVYTMHDVQKFGIARVVAKAIENIDPTGTAPLHLSFDIDGIDPVDAPGTGTLARGGLNYREAQYICTELGSTGRLVGMDLVEVNPLLDVKEEQMHGDDPALQQTTQTTHLAIDLIMSALGKNILHVAPAALSKTSFTQPEATPPKLCNKGVFTLAGLFGDGAEVGDGIGYGDIEPRLRDVIDCSCGKLLIEEFSQLVQWKDDGVLTDDEFQVMKTRFLFPVPA